jgi:formylglycine-generating enzyme required for sulfatase activity
MGRHVGAGVTDELPLHTVTLDGFFMDTFEVTNEGFAAYLNRSLAEGRVTVTGGVATQVGGGSQAICDTTGSDGSSGIEWSGTAFSARAGREDHPVLLVSWFGSCLYANDRSRQAGLPVCYDETTFACDFSVFGMRLPTEAEWEYAARGGEHAPYLAYPWGDTIDGSQANYWYSGDPFEHGTTPVGYYDGGQTPAGVDMANGYGLYDMSGNAWEWCHDRYGSAYYSTSPPSNPTGPATGFYRATRGGSWANFTTFLRSANRRGFDPTRRYADFGFRVLSVRP